VSVNRQGPDLDRACPELVEGLRVTQSDLGDNISMSGGTGFHYSGGGEKRLTRLEEVVL
jgi:hypothetical protein